MGNGKTGRFFLWRMSIEKPEGFSKSEASEILSSDTKKIPGLSPEFCLLYYFFKASFKPLPALNLGTFTGGI